MIKSLFKIALDISGKKVAIYGTDKKALLMFSVLLQNDVYVSCFITKDAANTDMNIMNKPITLFKDMEREKEQYAIVMSGQDMLQEAEKLDGDGWSVFFDYNKTSYDGDSIMIGKE